MRILILILVAVGAYFFFIQEERIDTSSMSYQAGYDDGINQTCNLAEREFPGIRDRLRQRRIC